jgi:hypothetical protein
MIKGKKSLPLMAMQNILQAGGKSFWRTQQ